MIFSMTAYTHQEHQDENGVLSCDIRALNHRYLEVNLKLPDGLKECEPLIRDAIRTQIKRGKLEVSLYYHPSAPTTSLTINDILATQLAEAAKTLTTIFQTPLQLNATDLLKWPGLLTTTEKNHNLVDIALQLMNTSLVALNESRQREGQCLQAFISERLNDIEQIVQDLKPHQSTLVAEQRQRLLDRIQEVGVSVEQNRLEQELVLFAHKTDIAEEISRLLIHIDEARRLLDSETPVGKKLDFLLQELNREANTLGSKAASLRITAVAIDCKVLLEQIREQIQNIE